MPFLKLGLVLLPEMNVNNQQGRLWLLAEKTPALESMYNELSQIAREMAAIVIPYKSEKLLAAHKDCRSTRKHHYSDQRPIPSELAVGSLYSRHFGVDSPGKGQKHGDLLDQFPFLQEASFLSLAFPAYSLLLIREGGYFYYLTVVS